MRIETTAVTTASERDYLEFLSFLGGEALARQSFPAHYGSTRQGLLRAQAAGAISLDILSVGRLKASRDRVRIVAGLTLDGDGGAFCSLFLRAVSKSTGKEVSRSDAMTPARRSALASLTLPAADYRDCVLELYGSDLASRRVVCGRQELARYMLGDEFTAEFTVNDPAKKTDPAVTGKDIIVSFAGYDAKSHRDYSYDYYNGDFQLPCKGKITLRKDGGNVDFISCERVSLSIAGDVGDLRYHQRANDIYSFSENALSWDTGADGVKWGFSVRDLITRSADLCYTLSFTCVLSLYPEQQVTFMVTNSPVAEENNLTKKIPMIKGYRDCVGEGALVTLADGRTRVPIEEIRPGQRVSDGKGGTAEVVNVWRTEGVDDLLRVTAEEALLISKPHRMRSGDRLVSAGTAGGNMLRAGNAGGGTGYNLELAGGETFVANGFVVEGITDAGMRYSTDKVRETLDPAYHKDFDSITGLRG